MLEIALAPAPIPFGKVDQRRRTFFITAGDFGHEIDLPASPAHEGGFDKVMAQDESAKRRRPGRSGKPACSIKALVRIIALCPQ